MVDEQESPPESKGGKSVRVRVGFPVGSFAGEGFPTITKKGTDLTSAELEAAQEAANASSVKLIIEDGS
jgi:hypothetical protein